MQLFAVSLEVHLPAIDYLLPSIFSIYLLQRWITYKTVDKITLSSKEVANGK